MQDETLGTLITETSRILELEKFVIEKDYHVTCAIQLLSNLENDFFHLVFAGGTCLAKGHRLVKRMSEDIDFKFEQKSTCENLSKTKLLKELKTFREQIVAKFEATDFVFEEIAARNEGQYLRIKLQYPSLFSQNATLRPHILLEFTSSKIKLPMEQLPVTSLIADTLNLSENKNPVLLRCISVEETAAEKWVGLTRRIAAIERGYFRDDLTLIRHVYDLSNIYHANKIQSGFYDIVSNIVANDAKQFKNQYPEYFENPADEIRLSLNTLKNNPSWRKRYQDFLQVMVYDSANALAYDDALSLITKTSEKVIHERLSGYRGFSQKVEISSQNDQPIPASTDNSILPMLKIYVDLQINQNRLVDKKHNLANKDMNAAKLISDEITKNNKLIHECAKKIIANHEAKSMLENTNSLDVKSIKSLDGYAGIKKRLENNEQTNMDIYSLIFDVKKTAERQIKLIKQRTHSRGI